MRILIFHGYLLSGTGSNVYNARLAEALVKLGHEVHLFSQDRHPERQQFVDAVGDWDTGTLELEALRAPGTGSAGVEAFGSDPGGVEASRSHAQARGPRGTCTVYRPDIGGLLPLYVQDRYEGTEAKTFASCTDAEVAAYVQANVDAVREVAQRVRPDVALANHLVMGPVILARALARETPYAAKVHGSALEYTVKPGPERFLGHAREGLAGARTVLVGSMHTAESLWAALEDPDLKPRTRLGPPGVDVQRFAPRDPHEAHAALRGLVERLRASAPAALAEQSSAFARDDHAAAGALARLLEAPKRAAQPLSAEAPPPTGSGPPAEPFPGELVAFVGKLIEGKGIDLLIAAWPLVLQRHPHARLVVVGFGSWREDVEHLCDTLTRGDLQDAQRTALPHLRAFLRSLDEQERTRYVSAARGLGEQIVFTGRLDHEELADLLPACHALVVPSTFPEAFGMVAVEAAACGVLPVSAGHSGLAEVSEILAREVPSQAASWLSFPVDEHAVRAIAERVCGWLGAEPALSEQTRAALVATARERWSWEGVARGVIAAAYGES